MKVVLYGASGMIGSRILSELLSRNRHQVTAVVRDTSKLAGASAAATVRSGNVLDPASVAETAAGADAAISAYAASFDDVSKLLTATHSILAGLKTAGVHRFLMVGGAGSLEVAPGIRLIDTPDFPAAWKPVAQAHSDALSILKKSDLDWTSLSPAGLIEPGERTGKFRLGLDAFMTDSQGQSRISAEDYAIAMVDELENPKHIRARFAVAY